MVSVLRSAPLRVLDDRDLPAVRAVLAQDSVANVFVASRIEAAGLDSWRLGAEVWGYVRDGRLDALCYSGANLVPACAGPRPSGRLPTAPGVGPGDAPPLSARHRPWRRCGRG